MFSGVITYLPSEDEIKDEKNDLLSKFEGIYKTQMDISEGKTIPQNPLKVEKNESSPSLYNISLNIGEKFNLPNNYYKKFILSREDILRLDYNISPNTTTISLSLRYNPLHFKITPGSSVVIKNDKTKDIIFVGFINSIKITKSISEAGFYYITEMQLSSWEHLYLRTIMHFLWQLGTYNLSMVGVMDLLGFHKSSKANISLGEFAGRIFLLTPALLGQFLYPDLRTDGVNLVCDKFTYEDETIPQTMLMHGSIETQSLIDVFNSFAKDPRAEIYFYPYPRREIYVGKKTWFYDDRTSNYFKKIKIPPDVVIREITLENDISRTISSSFAIPYMLEGGPNQALQVIGTIPMTYRGVYNTIRSGFVFSQLQTSIVKYGSPKNLESKGRKLSTDNEFIKYIEDSIEHLSNNYTKEIETYNAKINVKTDFFLISQLKQGDWIEFPLSKDDYYIGRINTINISYKISNRGIETFTSLNITNAINSKFKFNANLDKSLPKPKAGVEAISV